MLFPKAFLYRFLSFFPFLSFIYLFLNFFEKEATDFKNTWYIFLL